MGAAAADSIAWTAPGSINTLVSQARTHTMVRNNNAVSFNNQNYQIARSGNAAVTNNTMGTQHNNFCVPHMGNGVGDWSTMHAAVVTQSAAYQHPHIMTMPLRSQTYCPCSNERNSHHHGNNTSAINATSGNAANYNATEANVRITNQTPVVSQASVHAPVYSSISNTGPRSANRIDNSMTNNTSVVNTNTVNFDTVNSQTAVSGNATVSGNTSGGDARTGIAANTNTTDLVVSITNN
jgi:hypothetical protein